MENMNASTSISKDEILHGWMSGSNGRGTGDIIWSSGWTVILCSWTCLCLNVPAPTFRRWRIVFQKLLMCAFGGIGPEFIFHLALCQWASARRSVAAFRASNYQDWTMRHAFLADMGGFVLDTPDWIPFPLNAKQVHYLVVKGYVRYEDVRIDEAVIDEKNRVDGVGRLITLVQVVWFMVNCAARIAQGQAITTMELVAVGYIICAIGTYYFWFQKPMDVSKPILIQTRKTLRDILVDAGDAAAQPYLYTPMDFVGREPYPWRKYFKFWMHILWKMRLRMSTEQRPIDKIPDDYYPALNTPGTLFILFVGQFCYIAVHLCGWNFVFPTTIEHRLWHASSVMLVTSMAIFWAVDVTVWHILPRLDKLAQWRTSTTLSRIHCLEEKISPTRFGMFLNTLRNNSPDQDPDLSVPLKALLLVTAAAMMYCLARGYILVESIAGLRAMPASAYSTVTWYWNAINAEVILVSGMSLLESVLTKSRHVRF